MTGPTKKVLVTMMTLGQKRKSLSTAAGQRDSADHMPDAQLARSGHVVACCRNFVDEAPSVNTFNTHGL